MLYSRQRMLRSLAFALRLFLLALCLSLAQTLPARAQSGPSTLYLPHLTQYWGGGSEKELAAAGRLHTGLQYPDPTPLSDENEETIGNDDSSDRIETVVCTTQDWGESEIRELTDRTALGVDIGIIYPGALIQGQGFQDGLFTPITIPRAEGTIVMEGVTLSPGSDYSRNVEAVTPGNIQNAVKSVLENYVSGGTTANYGDQLIQTYSYEHMLFTLGLDARYATASMESSLQVETEAATSYTLYKFQQTFYDVIFEAPAQATDVFRDGADFDDVEDQIAPGNPPLYVSKVSYGRIVYFVARSEYSSTDVQATLEAAFKGGTVEGRTDTGLDYQEVMEKTTIYTYVLGGNAGDAVQNINGSTPEERFTRIRDFVSDYGAANFSATNPGAPIAYELRYLADRELARMSYTTTYTQRDCTTLVAARDYNIIIDIYELDVLDDADVGDGEVSFEFWVEGEYSDRASYPNSGYTRIDDGDHPIEISEVVQTSRGDDEDFVLRASGEEEDFTSADDDMGDITVTWLFSDWITAPTEESATSTKIDGQFAIKYNIRVTPK